MWLAMKLFGNGNGMAAPHCDGRFFWLVDASIERSHKSEGRFYQFSGWLGAQLASYEWRAPNAGTRRRLAGMEFTVFQISRGWIRDPFGLGINIFPLMWRVSWSVSALPKDINAANAFLRDMEKRLGELCPQPGRAA